MAARCPEPRSSVPIDAVRLARAVERIPYEPPPFKRRVLYTIQACKVPLPGQELGEPRPEYEARGLYYGELFVVDGYTLVDLDIIEGGSPIDLYMRLSERLPRGVAAYPTRRGVHVYVEGSYGPATLEASIDGFRVRVEVKPCSRFTCTSFYRTLNVHAAGDKLLAVNARYFIVLSRGYRLIEYRVIDSWPAAPDVLSRALGVDIARAVEPRGKSARLATHPYAERIKSFGKLTDARAGYNWFKSKLARLRPVDPETVVKAIDEAYERGLLPPCLAPIATGVHENNRFATLAVLVAALTAANLGIPEDGYKELCDILVDRWGGSRNQCYSKLRSILVCMRGVCGYAYGFNLLSELIPKLSCDRLSCPYRWECSPDKPRSVIITLSKLLYKWLVG